MPLSESDLSSIAKEISNAKKELDGAKDAVPNIQKQVAEKIEAAILSLNIISITTKNITQIKSRKNPSIKPAPIKPKSSMKSQNPYCIYLPV